VIGNVSDNTTDMSVLLADRVSVRYSRRGESVVAVDRASLEIAAGEAVGIVGESGSGKSTLASACLGLLSGNARVSGTMRIVGVDATSISPGRWTKIRGRRIGYVGQDPFGALNPVLRVHAHMDEALAATPRTKRRGRAIELLQSVDLPAECIDAFPHELSGGMRQRVSIAMALAGDPQLLIADEPTTALDVTTQAEILALLGRLRTERNMALLLISHDLGVVRMVCDRIYVMYRGRVVEHGSVQSVLDDPRHAYTQRLRMCARLERDETGAFIDGTRLAGLSPEAMNQSSGELIEVASGHFAALPEAPGALLQNGGMAS